MLSKSFDSSRFTLSQSYLKKFYLNLYLNQALVRPGIVRGVFDR